MKNLTDNLTLLNQLSALKFIEVDAPVLSYDILKRQLVYTFIGRNSLSQEHVVEIKIKRTDLFRIESVNVFTPSGSVMPFNITTPLTVTAVAGTPFSLTIGGNTETPPSLQVVTPPSYVPILNAKQTTSFLLNFPGTASLYDTNHHTTFILSL